MTASADLHSTAAKPGRLALTPATAATVRAALEQAGCRYTRQRAAVFAYLENVDCHPTAEEVYKAVRRQMPRISLGTVYKSLEALVKSQLATKITNGDGSSRYDCRGCFVAGYLFGLPALRLEGIYLALATFALAIALPQILKFSPIEHWTGGVQGIVIIKPDAPFGLPINPDRWLYYFTLFVLLLSFAFAYNLVGSRTGRAITAIRDNPIAAKAMGVNLSLYKSLTFGVSAFYTGVAGALGAIVVQFVAPDSFTFALSVVLFVGLVVGGVGWIPGAFFGALFILFVPHLAEGVSKGLAGAVYGIMLILLIFVMPSGAAGLLKLVFDRLAAAGWWKVSPEGRK